MTRIFTRMPDADSVAPGNTATFRVPTNPRRLHYSYLKMSGGLTAALIDEIRVLSGQTIIQRMTGAQRNTINKFLGLTDSDTSNMLVIPFDRPGLKSRQMEELTALNVGVAGPNGEIINQLTIEVDIAAAAPGTVALKHRAEQSPAVEGGPGAVARLLPQTFINTEVGEKEFSQDNIGSGSRLSLNAAYFFTGNFNRLQVQRNQKDVFDRDTDDNELIQSDGVRVPQAGLFVYDRTERGYGADPLDLRGLEDFRYVADIAAAGDFKVFQEFIGTLPV